MLIWYAYKINNPLITEPQHPPEVDPEVTERTVSPGQCARREREALEPGDDPAAS